MNGKYLLDTNIVIAVFEGDPDVLRKLDGATEVFLCVPVVGELKYGALASSRMERNLKRVEELSTALKTLECDLVTTDLYARVRIALRKKGKPIPENDVWISALAFQHNLTLVSRDSHFKEVDQLQLEVW